MNRNIFQGLFRLRLLSFFQERGRNDLITSIFLWHLAIDIFDATPTERVTLLSGFALFMY